jgi:hypothetical protein
MLTPERVTQQTVAWWQLWFRDDAASKADFIGSSCGFCGADEQRHEPLRLRSQQSPRVSVGNPRPLLRNRLTDACGALRKVRKRFPPRDEWSHEYVGGIGAKGARMLHPHRPALSGEEPRTRQPDLRMGGVPMPGWNA